MMAKASDQPSDMTAELKGKLIESLRQRARLSNMRANFSLALVVGFIAVGLYVFFGAGAIAIQETALLR